MRHHGWELLALFFVVRERERERSRVSFVVIWECAWVFQRWRWRATISQRQVVFNKRGFLTHWQRNYGFPYVGSRQKRERETQKVRYKQLGRNLRHQEWKAASLSLHYPWVLCSSSPVSSSMSFRWDIHTLKNPFPCWHTALLLSVSPILFSGEHSALLLAFWLQSLLGFVMPV